MADLELITAQYSLLRTHRQTLQLLLEQKAQFGSAYAPPVMLHSINQARIEIATIKHFLRSQGEQIDDLPHEQQGDTEQPSLSQSVYNGIDAIIKMLPLPAVRDAAVKFRIVFEQACRQIQVVNFYKKLHDEFQDLEILLNRLEDDHRQLERMVVDWGELTIFDEFQEKIEDLHHLVAQTSSGVENERWAQQLDAATKMLRSAVLQEDSRQVETVIKHVYRVLNREPTRINARLVGAAEELLFTELTTALKEVHANLNQTRFDFVATRDIEQSIHALTTLSTTLQHSVRNHQQWQHIDDELRRVEANLSIDITELELAWPDLQLMTVSAYGNSSAEWALTLTRMWLDLEHTLMHKIVDKIRPQFRKYRRKASRRFRQVDDELLGLCNELQTIGTSLNLLLRAIE